VEHPDEEWNFRLLEEVKDNFNVLIIYLISCDNMTMPLKLYAAPLQGFTEAPLRVLHQQLFGGVDAYYSPFVRVKRCEKRFVGDLSFLFSQHLIIQQ
jgi:tRNA-dihydrouridine synthase